jgi:hypothetical protein
MRFVARSIEFHMCSSIFIHVIRTKKLDKELCRFVAYSWGGGGEGAEPPLQIFPGYAPICVFHTSFCF